MRPKHWHLAAIATATVLLATADLSARLSESAGTAPAAASPARGMTLQHDPRFILEAVARRMQVTLRPEIPLPAILFESATRLERVQAIAEAQWGFRPPVFVSTYSVARNEIYLIDDPAYYLPHDRTLDDTLAHEFVHYLQATYLGDDFSTDSSESEAVAIQTWFREQYVQPVRTASMEQRASANR